jgi:hypothetical protein
MNAFCASVNFDAFMRFRSSPSQGFSAENSNQKRGRFRGSHQFVEGALAQAMLAAHLRSRHPSFLFFDRPNDLGFRETALSHSFASSKG